MKTPSSFTLLHIISNRLWLSVEHKRSPFTESPNCSFHYNENHSDHRKSSYNKLKIAPLKWYVGGQIMAERKSSPRRENEDNRDISLLKLWLELSKQVTYGERNGSYLVNFDRCENHIQHASPAGNNACGHGVGERYHQEAHVAEKAKDWNWWKQLAIERYQTTRRLRLLTSLKEERILRSCHKAQHQSSCNSGISKTSEFPSYTFKPVTKHLSYPAA